MDHETTTTAIYSSIDPIEVHVWLASQALPRSWNEQKLQRKLPVNIPPAHLD